MNKKILIVDDEASLRELLSIALQKEGYEVFKAENGQKALELIEDSDFDMIISDVKMPEMTGLELLAELRSKNMHTLFLVMTAFGTMDTAIEAMKLGAYDYINKPFKLDEVRLIVQKALHTQKLELENRVLRKELKKEVSFENMIGDSEPMREVFDMISRISHMPTHVLITGESGVGKEMVAKAIHHHSSYKDKPFVAINCGAIPENLIESELFGHKKGAFTGANMDKKGLFEVAHGGSLFLDEIGEVSPLVQVKLLRALQEKKIRRVGGNQDIPVDVRIISATNKDLQKMIQEKQFREDLYYRINVIQIHCPSLRQRKEDIVLLANHFLKKYSERFGKDIQGMSKEALMLLNKYDYPGNVRELENIIERAVALESTSVILKESLPPMAHTIKKGMQTFSAGDIDVKQGLDLDHLMNQIEKEILIKAIHNCNGVKKRAAELLGISFRSMRYRAEKHGLGSEDDSEEVA